MIIRSLLNRNPVRIAIPSLAVGILLAVVFLWIGSAWIHAQDVDPATGTDPNTRAMQLKSQRDRIKALMEARRVEIERRKEAREAQESQVPGATPPPDGAPPPPQPGATPPPNPEEAPPPPLTAQTYLFIDPQRTSVKKGDIFDTRIKVMNDKFLPLDELEIRLKYAQDVLELVAVSDENIRKYSASPPVYENNATTGVVYYKNTLKEAHPFRNETLLTLRWRALTPAMSVTLRFLQSIEKGALTTALRSHGVDRLGEEAVFNDGTLMAEVAVIVPGRDSGKPMAHIPMVDRNNGIRLRMALDKGVVQVGEITTMTVYLDNPSQLMMDTVRIRMWFDPRILQVEDWDRRNWIKLGLNVQDGLAREDFPFTFHGTNLADNTYGQIDYQMSLTGRFTPPTAPLFKVKFVAKASAEENYVCFDITPDRRRTAPQTALFYEGGNMMDYEAMLGDYSIFCNVPVAPKAETSLAAEKP